MIYWILAGGPLMNLLIVLTLVILALSIKKSIDLFLRSDQERERLERGLSAILFWGCVCAVVGFLGQFSGLYLSLQVIRHAGVISPQRLAEGLAVSLITPLTGLVILVVSAVIWFGLRARYLKLVSHREREAAA
jgi:biopolymer transport protein ExbB/TolQ